MRKCIRRRSSLFALALTAVPIPIAHSATNYTWNSGLQSYGDWATPADWTPNGVPSAAGDSAYILPSGIFGNTVLYDYTGAATTLNVVQIDELPYGKINPTAILNIPSDTLSANNEYVGDSGSSSDGSGAINQSGGVNNVSGQTGSTLFIAYNQGDTGTYTLSGSATLNATNIVVGVSGNATFTQTGGTANFTSMTVNQNYGNATYNLSGNGVINATSEIIGSNGSGTGGATFMQSGGLNKAASIGVAFGGNGTYTQIGGAVVASNQFNIGSNQYAGDGTYNLEAGTLTTGAVSIGIVGYGALIQTGGTHFATSLTMGNAPSQEGAGGDGIYNLSGDGSLIVGGYELISLDGTGSFVQSGGTNTDDGDMEIPAAGGQGAASYLLSGGAVSDNSTSIGAANAASGARGNLSVTGTGTFTDPVGMNLQSSGTIALGGGTLTTASIQMSGGTFNWTSGTLNITGPNGLTIDAGNVLGANASITSGKILNVSATLTNNQIFTNSSLVTARNVANIGTFTSSGTLAVGSSFVNSGTAILGGVQNWSTGATFTNSAGNAAFQTDAGSAASYPLSVILTGGNVTLASPQHWAGLTITSGILDVSNDHLILSYGSTDPKATILSYLKAGSNGGSWTGSTGVLSFTAAGSNGQYGVGFADGADGIDTSLTRGQIEIAYALNGDANLDGKVNGSDFTILATNFNRFVTNGWEAGDFNYDGAVNGTDFVLLASNFNQFASEADVSSADLNALNSFASANSISVPEPACATLLMIAGTSLASRRRRFSRTSVSQHYR